MITQAEYNNLRLERFRLKKQIAEMIKTKCVHKIHDIKRRLDSINRLMKIYEEQVWNR